MPLGPKPPPLTLPPTPYIAHQPSTSFSSSHLSGHTSPHASRTSMESSGDSGYHSASGSHWLAPDPDWALARTYENWRIADAATQRLLVDRRALNDCLDKLRAAKKRREQALRTAKPGRKPSLLHIPFKRKSVKPGDPLPSPPADLSEPLPSVEDLEAQYEILKQRVDATEPAAKRLDGYFEDLRKVLDDGRPISWRSSISSGHAHSSADEYTKARRTVGARDRSYLDSKATTQALQQACTAIQSAHHHYSKAMESLDAVCSPNKNRWEAMMGDEQSRQATYREATEWAHKAQLCFKACVDAIQPHWELLKDSEQNACLELQETELLQAVQLYNLMYGGKVLAMGITQQVQTMFQKQDAVYQRLTDFAVGIQDCTKHCEAVELNAQESREEARRRLVALWVSEEWHEHEEDSPIAPHERRESF